MPDIKQAKKALVKRILEGNGKESSSGRRAAFNNNARAEPLRTLVSKVAMHANTVTDEDITAVRRAGLSEDQIFEIVVCAAVGQANRQYDAAFVALANATGGSEHAASNSQ